MKAEVSCCLIVKNEPLLERCLQSIRPFVSEIVVVDTNSTDNITQEIAKKYADIFEIYTDCNDPETGLIEDFSKARQRSFDLASKPYLIWIDADDIIEGGEHLPFIIEDFEKNKGNIEAVSFMFPYEYAYDLKGNVICRHFRERLIFNKKCFKWQNPVHECLVPIESAKTVFITREEVIFKHQRQYSNKPPEQGRNLRILKRYVEKIGDTDARQLYYIGLEYCNVGMIKEAIESLTKYVGVSGWDDEIACACLKLVDIYQALGQYEEALKWAFKTVDTFENWAEGFFALAKNYYYLAPTKGVYEQKYWQKCVYFAKLGLSLPPTKTLLFINPLERDVLIHEYLNVALNKMGDIIGALESVNTGLKKDPENANLLTNKKIYETHLAKENVLINLRKLQEIGELESGAIETIGAIVNKQLSLIKPPNEPPEQIIGGSGCSGSFPQLIAFNNSEKLDIIFMAGNGVESWNPSSIAVTGIGGSELMMAELSQRLAAQGHRVRVYNSCGTEDKYNGVEYYQTEKFQDLKCDVLIVSRRADYLDDKYNIEAKLVLLWTHDLAPINPISTLLMKCDRVLALSNFHKNFILQHFASIHPDQVIVTRNGIDLKRFEKSVKRNNHKAICSSSPDRYLPVLLNNIWPRIREAIPDAELVIAYGFKNWEFSAQNDPLQTDLINSLKLQLKNMESLGVKFLDRINQKQLAEEMLSCGVALYPTWFQETYFISGNEYLAAGLRIITSPIGAINDTIGDKAYKLISGEWTSQKYADQFVQATIEAMNKDDDSDRKLLKEYAKNSFCLDKLSRDWEGMFHSLIDELKTNPLVKYKDF